MRIIHGLCFYKEAILCGFNIISIFHTPLKKREDSWNRMGGLVRSTFDKVHKVHELVFLYASVMLSLRYCLCGFYTDSDSTKKSPKNLCYVNT